MTMKPVLFYRDLKHLFVVRLRPSWCQLLQNRRGRTKRLGNNDRQANSESRTAILFAVTRDAAFVRFDNLTAQVQAQPHAVTI